MAAKYAIQRVAREVLENKHTHTHTHMHDQACDALIHPSTEHSRIEHYSNAICQPSLLQHHTHAPPPEPLTSLDRFDRVDSMPQGRVLSSFELRYLRTTPQDNDDDDDDDDDCTLPTNPHQASKAAPWPTYSACSSVL